MIIIQESPNQPDIIALLNATAAGLAGLKLDTGISQPEAIVLYQRAPLSLFMERPL
ncbi:hypothetical protein [Massilia sp. TWP1-3-3]|uniref:hypothetical protein n=1 Tax=Massilia sp. TWP1-3-3 TaxID=2804573 RepID=UPI003CF6AB19